MTVDISCIDLDLVGLDRIWPTILWLWVLVLLDSFLADHFSESCLILWLALVLTVEQLWLTLPCSATALQLRFFEYDFPAFLPWRLKMEIMRETLGRARRSDFGTFAKWTEKVVFRGACLFIGGSDAIDVLHFGWKSRCHCHVSTKARGAWTVLSYGFWKYHSFINFTAQYLFVLLKDVVKSVLRLPW